MDHAGGECAYERLLFVTGELLRLRRRPPRAIEKAHRDELVPPLRGDKLRLVDEALHGVVELLRVALLGDLSVHLKQVAQRGRHLLARALAVLAVELEVAALQADGLASGRLCVGLRDRVLRGWPTFQPHDEVEEMKDAARREHRLRGLGDGSTIGHGLGDRVHGLGAQLLPPNADGLRQRAGDGGGHGHGTRFRLGQR